MIPVVCADGETRSHASHIFPIRDPHGELLALCAAWSPPHDTATLRFGRSTETVSRPLNARVSDVRDSGRLDRLDLLELRLEVAQVVEQP